MMHNSFLRGKDVVLASNSPRRKELMSLLCDNFRVVPSNAREVVDEKLAESFTDKPAQTAEYLATIKAKNVALSNDSSVVFGCDTVVAVDDKILGKPKNDDDARAMLKSLSATTHRVISGVCVCYKDMMTSFFCETKVKFYSLDDETIESYIRTGEHKDKAGSYGIQGFGSLLCEKIEGDFFNVVGFPVSEINQRLNRFFEED